MKIQKFKQFKSDDDDLDDNLDKLDKKLSELRIKLKKGFNFPSDSIWKETLFNKFKRDDLKIGDYVKIKETSPFYKYKNGNGIFHIDRLDKISAYLSTIDGKHPDLMFSEMLRRNLRKLTDSEKKDLDFILKTIKYNI